MSSEAPYPYPSPLSGKWAGLPELGEERTEDGKSLKNPTPTVKSEAYDSFTYPLSRGRDGGFDFHIYYDATNPQQLQYARELHTRIRHEFPELRIYRFWEQAVGPHTQAMFEVNLFSPHQFGAFAAWLAVWRGGLSVLVHPNTVEVVDGKEVRSERLDHTERAIWMGKRLELKMEIFDWIEAKEKEEEEKKTVQAQGQAAL